MKILVVTESYWPNADGGALFERRLALGLNDLGHDVTVWAPGQSWRRQWEQDGPYRIRREGAVRFIFNRKYKVSYWPWLEGWRLMRQVRPDVVHIHNTYWMGLAGLLWAKVYHRPVLATNHFMPENALLNLRGVKWLYRPLHRLIWKVLVWFHNRCDYVTSPTPTAVKLLVDNGLTKPSQAISNGIDTSVFRPDLDAGTVRHKYSLPTDVPILLYLGRVDGEKRLDIILRALPLILERQPVHLVIAGYGIAMPGLKALAARLGIKPAVTFTGFIEENDKPLLYNLASAFVIASPSELQSIVTLEAMASGLPILSVDVAALSELCHDGANGWLFPENDHQALADKTIRLLASPATIKIFGAESRRIVGDHHSNPVTVTLYEQACRKAIKLAVTP